MTDLVPVKKQRKDKLGILAGKHTTSRDNACSIPVNLMDCYVSVHGVLSQPETRLIIGTVLLLSITGVTVFFLMSRLA